MCGSKNSVEFFGKVLFLIRSFLYPGYYRVVREISLITEWHPIQRNISMHSLHTVLYTFPKVLTRRIWLTIKIELLHPVIISFFLMTLMFDSGVILHCEIRCQSILRVKRLRDFVLGKMFHLALFLESPFITCSSK